MKLITVTLSILVFVLPTALSAKELDEIVVTAERRTTTLQDTPLSVIALSADDLDRAGVTDIQYLQDITPGLQISGTRGGQQGNVAFSIRGVSAIRTLVSGERTVGLYVDDIYFPRMTGDLLKTLDVERIEVLRGPQGTLFGRNSAGGAVRYITKRPSEQREFRVQGTVGEFDRADLNVIFNAPLSDTVFFRGQAASLNRDGHIKRGDADLGNVDSTVLRGQLRFKPSDVLTVDIGVTYSDSNANGIAATITGYPRGPNARGENAVLMDAILATDPSQPPFEVDDSRFLLDDYSVPEYCLLDGDTDPFTFLSRAEAESAGFGDQWLSDCSLNRSNQSTLAFLDINWVLSESMALRLLTGFGDGEHDVPNDWVFNGSFMTEAVENDKMWSQEIQLTGQSERLDWVTGLYFFHESASEFRSRLDTIRGAATRVERTEARDYETDSIGVFGQATWHPTSALSITGGLRYSEDEKSSTIVWGDVASGSFVPFDGLALPANATYDSTDFRLTFAYDLAESVMAFVTYSTGYMAGQINDSITTDLWFDDPADGGNGDGIAQLDECIDLCRDSVEPQTVRNIEVGIRAQWLDNRVRTNLTYFDMLMEDLHTAASIEIVEPSGELTIITRRANAGEAELKGWEAEAELAATNNLTFRLAASYMTKHEITDAGDVETDLDLGSEVVTPDLTYTIGLLHNLDLTGGGSLSSSLSYAYRDGYFTHLALNRGIDLDADRTLNGSVKYTSASGNWSLALVGTNLTDQVNAFGGQFFGGPRGDVALEYRSRPRQIGLRFEYNSSR